MKKGASAPRPAISERQPLDIALGQRLDEGVDHRGRGALVLADLGRDLVRGGEIEVGMRLGDRRGRGLLVRRVGVGVQEDDGERLHARGDQLRRLRQQRRFVERDQRIALGVHALGHFEPEVARRQRVRLGDEDVVELVFTLAADLQRVAKALGRDQAGDRALALDQRIGEQRSRVDGAVDRGRRNFTVERLFHPGDDAAGGVVVGGQLLRLVDLPGRLVENDDVGEGAPDVDSERMRLGHEFLSFSGLLVRNLNAGVCYKVSANRRARDDSPRGWRHTRNPNPDLPLPQQNRSASQPYGCPSGAGGRRR